jgi:hypothetical protein
MIQSIRDRYDFREVGLADTAFLNVERDASHDGHRNAVSVKTPPPYAPDKW